MEVFIASDHAGFDVKQYIIGKSGLNLIDLGTNNRESCDYPVFANKLSNSMLEATDSYGILICATGIGMTITANRHRWIRAALCFNEKMAKLSREHNNANVIIFGADIIGKEMALGCVRLFFETRFEGGRHSKRLKLIDIG